VRHPDDGDNLQGARTVHTQHIKSHTPGISPYQSTRNNSASQQPTSLLPFVSHVLGTHTHTKFQSSHRRRSSPPPLPNPAFRHASHPCLSARPHLCPSPRLLPTLVHPLCLGTCLVTVRRLRVCFSRLLVVSPAQFAWLPAINRLICTHTTEQPKYINTHPIPASSPPPPPVFPPQTRLPRHECSSTFCSEASPRPPPWQWQNTLRPSELIRNLHICWCRR
jgi:hypothetical protein